jgi:hypothetical protein
MKYIIILSLFLSSCSIFPTGQELIDQGLLEQENVPTPASIEESYRWVFYNIEYVKDEGDYWQNPIETLTRRTGDCEDQVIMFLWLVSSYFSTKGEMVIFAVEGVSTSHSVALVNGKYYDFNNILNSYNTTQICVLSYDVVMDKIKKP